MTHEDLKALAAKAVELIRAGKTAEAYDHILDETEEARSALAVVALTLAEFSDMERSAVAAHLADAAVSASPAAETKAAEAPKA